MTEKAVNYTDEMVAKMLEAYDANAEAEVRKATVEALAKELNKPVKSIVAKLVNLEVYVKPEKAGKKGGVKKGDLATKIGEILGLAENDASSLEKATLNALKAVLAKIESAD